MLRASRSASIRPRRCRASRSACAPTAASAATSAACTCSSSTGKSIRGVRRVEGVRWAEWLGARSRRVAFTPNDTLAAKQWYLQQDRAFDFWPEAPLLPSVKVAVVDSGIDVTHPELATRVLATRTFVGGTVADVQGHGTFVAGEIAAATNNGEGIAGIGVSGAAARREGRAQRREDLARGRGEGDPVGGRQRRPRDQPQPRRPARPEEPFARHVLAARGRGGALRGREGRVWSSRRSGTATQAPSTPWPYASYPAALPHVVGVSSIGRDNSVSGFSDRDAGLQRHRCAGRGHPLHAAARADPHNAGCVDQGYSDCGPDRVPARAWNVFAAPQVSAAAALLLAQNPDADGRPGGDAARALGRRPELDRPAAPRARPVATRSPGGGGSTSPRRLTAAKGIPPAPRRLRGERRRRRPLRRPDRAATAARPRRSTTGTILRTSIRSNLVARRRLTVSLSGPLARRRGSHSVGPANAQRLRRARPRARSPNRRASA